MRYSEMRSFQLNYFSTSAAETTHTHTQTCTLSSCTLNLNVGKKPKPIKCPPGWECRCSAAVSSWFICARVHTSVHHCEWVITCQVAWEISVPPHAWWSCGVTLSSEHALWLVPVSCLCGGNPTHTHTHIDTRWHLMDPGSPYNVKGFFFTSRVWLNKVPSKHTHTLGFSSPMQLKLMNFLRR